MLDEQPHAVVGNNSEVNSVLLRIINELGLILVEIRPYLSPAGETLTVDLKKRITPDKEKLEKIFITSPVRQVGIFPILQ